MPQKTRPAPSGSNHIRTIERVFSMPFPDLKNAKAHQIRLLLDKVTTRLQRERSRGKLKHYGYDMNKHIALAAARNALRTRLKQMEQK